MIVLVRDVSIHNSSEPVAMCSGAQLLPAMGDVLQPVPTFPH